MASYTVLHQTPSVETYLDLRLRSGMSPKSHSAAATEGTAETTLELPTTVGMGRIIGDGALFFQVVDIAVLPAHQGKGLGKWIMKELESWIVENVPPTGYISLGADGKAKALYAQYGFIETSTYDSIGMARPVVPEI
ncbi:N-acetyltransferase GCN5 [Athelia psychrophila]|uniref:N-acetyltransferase GCN5 n=1 Tax=Athelia psychrophila TaxID=1759441 RepID=A0A166PUN0_9AGAM|nr:N-acetyltransferase GCN5 [Fibularhizoctonia sp. CBS 109695]